MASREPLLAVRTDTTYGLKQIWADLESDELFLPGMKSRETDLLQGLMAKLEVDPVWGDSELESHSLVSFCHGE
jgi:hypothetical protein